MGTITIKAGSEVEVGAGSEITVKSGALALPNLAGHYDFSDASTLWQDSARTIAITADGQTIRGVTDKSGTGNHLDDDSGAGGVFYRTNIQNGLSVGSNISGSGYLQNLSFNVGSPHAVVFVCRTPSSISGGFGNSFFSSGPGAGNTTNLQLTTTTTRYFSTQAAFVTSVLDSPPTLTNWEIYVWDYDGVTNPTYIQNTFDVNNAGGALTRTLGLRLFHDDSLGGGEWDSYGGEVYVFDGVFSAATRVALVNLLKAKWAI